MRWSAAEAAEIVEAARKAPVHSGSKPWVLELHGRETGRVWPGDSQVYLLDPGERKSVLIDCHEGENICYGAWVYGDDRLSYGVGPDGDRRCRDCCSVCVAKTTTTIDMPQ